MRSSVFALTFNGLLKPFLMWLVGFCAFLLMITGLYPLFASFPDLAARVQAAFLPVQVFLGDPGSLASPDGFVFSLAFSMVIPLACCLFAILYASSLVSTPDERGMIELLLSRPLPRWRLVLEKYAALGVDILLICASLWALLAWRSSTQGLGINLGNLAWLLVSLGLLGLCWAGIALAIGILTRSRKRAIQVSLALLAASLLMYLAPGVSGGLAWMRSLSLLDYYMKGNPLVAGLNGGHAAVLAVLSAGCVAAALAVFQNRDL
jgi:ABC-2 type transport system permease protein